MATYEDPFLDDETLHRVQFNTSPEAWFEELKKEDPDTLVPSQIVTNIPVVENEPEPEVVEAPEEPRQPKVLDLKKGGKITEIKTDKGWELVLESDRSNPERFRGATKEEAYMRLAEGKLEATFHINKLNREIKLGEPPVSKLTLAPPQAPQAKALSADEAQRIKDLWNTNPDAAFQEMWKLKTGRPFDQSIQDIERGRQAKLEADLKDVCEEFKSAYPSYYQDSSNFVAIVQALSKRYLGTVPTARDADLELAAIKLYEAGHWTVQDLGDTFVDLAESGLLKTKPKATPKPAETVVPPQPTPQPQPEAGIPQKKQPRAGLGLRAKDVSSSIAKEDNKPQPDEDFSNLTNEQIIELMNGIRVHKQKHGFAIK